MFLKKIAPMAVGHRVGMRLDDDELTTISERPKEKQ